MGQLHGCQVKFQGIKGSDVIVRRIYQLEKSAHQSRAAADAESRPLIAAEDPEEVFSKALGIELEKICSFYVSKEGELSEEVEQLLRDVGDGTFDDEPNYLRRMSSADVQQRQRRDTRSRSPRSVITDNISGDDSGSDEDETTGLTKRRGSNTRRKTLSTIRPYDGDANGSSDLGRSARRHSTTADDYGEQALMFGSGLFSSGIMIKKRIISLYVQLCELKSYVQLNRTGFNKVLKKFDKILDKELKNAYIKAHVESAYPFKPEVKRSIEENIRKMEEAYTEVVTNGDEELARKDLRSHLREHVVWERNTVWRDLIGIERRAAAARLGPSLLGQDQLVSATRLQGDEIQGPATRRITTPFGSINIPPWLASSSVLSLCMCLTVFFLLLFLPIMEKTEQQNCLALLVFVSLLWATEVRFFNPLPEAVLTYFRQFPYSLHHS